MPSDSSSDLHLINILSSSRAEKEDENGRQLLCLWKDSKDQKEYTSWEYVKDLTKRYEGDETLTQLILSQTVKSEMLSPRMTEKLNDTLHISSSVLSERPQGATLLRTSSSTSSSTSVSTNEYRKLKSAEK